MGETDDRLTSERPAKRLRLDDEQGSHPHSPSVAVNNDIDEDDIEVAPDIKEETKASDLYLDTVRRVLLAY